MYKYLPPERTDILDNNLICFNDPINFNDPFEFHTVFDLNKFDDEMIKNLLSTNLLEYLPKEYIVAMNGLDAGSKKLIEEKEKNILPILYENNKPWILEYVKGMFNVFNKNFINITRVLSLSSDPKNILMWGHYANSHSGFLIEFDTQHLFFNQKRSENDEYGFLREVIYQNEIPCLNPLSNNPVNHFITKSKDWLYEKEWRMLLPENYSKKKIHCDGKTFDLFHLPPEAIKKIILGCRASTSLEENITAILSQRTDYRHVNILKASRSNERFEVII